MSFGSVEKTFLQYEAEIHSNWQQCILGLLLIFYWNLTTEANSSDDQIHFFSLSLFPLSYTYTITSGEQLGRIYKLVNCPCF